MQDLLNNHIQPYMNLYANNINANNVAVFQNIDISGNLNIKNTSNLSITTPNAGYQTIFGNSDLNNNLTSKNSSGNIISLSSSLSNFIVGDGMQYQTIQSAIDAALLTGNNETIIIKPGTYTENITLQPKISITSQNPDFTVTNNPVSIIGLLSVNFTGEASINNLSFSNDSANCINIIGNCTININNCNFTTTTSGDCLYVNDPLSNVNIRNCNFISCASNYININNSSSCVLFQSFVGLNTNGNLIVNGGVLSISYSGIGGTLNINSLCVCLNNVISIGDIPAFNIGAPGLLLITSTMIFSNNTSSTDFAIGTGTILNSPISLLGRTTVAGTLTTMPLATF